MTPKLTITGFSTAMFATWYFVQEWGILFDCGDGVSAGLLQKARKIRRVFLSHADRDHIAGLLQFHQLNARNQLHLHYPKDSGSFPALARFFEAFDPHASGASWIPLDDSQEIPLRNDLRLRTLRNSHIVAKDGQVKSLGFFVDQIVRKLKPEWSGMSRTEIAQARRDHGESAVLDEKRRTLLAYSGDTPIAADGRWNDVHTLIHEATFLSEQEIDPDNPRRNKHSSLDQVLRMVSESNVQRLVLGHFSSRYSAEQIDEAILLQCRRFGISIPVFRILPGQMMQDILTQPSLTGE